MRKTFAIASLACLAGLVAGCAGQAQKVLAQQERTELKVATKQCAKIGIEPGTADYQDCVQRNITSNREWWSDWKRRSDENLETVLTVAAVSAAAYGAVEHHPTTSSDRVYNTPQPSSSAPRENSRSSNGTAVTLCPDGSYVSGRACQMAPDGTYHGDRPQMAPNGRYTSGQPRMAPDGSYVGGSGPTTMCPDGSYVSGRCQMAPDGTYVGQ